MSTCFSLISVLCAINVGISFGEMYTSMMNVKQAILAEKELTEALKAYIERETQRLDDIKRFYLRVLNLHNGVYNQLSTATSNPLVAFTLVKRLQSEWLNVVYSNEAQDNTQDLKSDYERMKGSLPTLEDLQGAAQGLMRLQDVYALHVKGLVRGQFQRITDGKTVNIYKPSVSMSLSGDDCFLIGKVAYDVEDYYHSVQWLEEAVRLFRGIEWSPEHEGTLEDALDHLAFSHFMTGNISYALSLSRELLHHDPMNKRVLLNVKKYEKILVENPSVGSSETVLSRPSSTYLRTRNMYERLCQTQGSQPRHYENPELFCDYFTNDNPGLLLQPMKREVVSLQPYVVLFHSFITDVEAQSIRDLALPGLRRSVVASGEKQATADYRISKSAWLKGTAHNTIGKLDRRITMLTGLNVQPPYGEHLQVVNYGIGGHYEPHFDHATSESSPLYSLKTGNRVATFMIYLSSVEAGGSTAFIYANFSVPVEKNGALFWWNLHRNGQGNGDTLHAGCPVLVGDKWVANKWVHEYGQEFQRRCSRNPEE
ncbi:prolyl 4-hydroxylase subunit alpha-3-like [Chanos chanos]|uniref:Prolyl 4-hydroxylase subunit alpha-3 n=1 Tax=Chanos chanos TaxID=29144 RepID=A0A6J2VNA7_CHACN|nr:prolyl 4-hydroxylase subunit alpha-3-like [Chanos chanos]